MRLRDSRDLARQRAVAADDGKDGLICEGRQAFRAAEAVCVALDRATRERTGRRAVNARLTQMDERVRLGRSQATALLRSIGIHEPVTVSVIREFNHVYRLQAGDQVFFLKTHTKAWYRGDAQAPARCVIHEQCAWYILAGHGVPTPEVVLVASDTVNALGRPFILTRRLPGAPLTHLLGQVTEAQQRQLLVATGDYLRRMHAITFTYPGYLMSTGGPAAPPTDQDWQHRSWTPGARKKSALGLLATRGSELTPELGDRLHGLFESMPEMLEASCLTPRFVHGDCHAHHFFVDMSGAEPEITGVIDMEVASAGDPIEDLLKFSLEVATILPARTRWWQALFDGYGQEPDYTLFRLRMLGCSPEEFACVRPGSAERPWGDVVRHLLAVDGWLDLFADGW